MGRATGTAALGANPTVRGRSDDGSHKVTGDEELVVRGQTWNLCERIIVL
jgi:hypothetical protein